MSSSSSIAVSETLSRIFADMPSERLYRRRSPRSLPLGAASADSAPSERETKRVKRESPPQLHTELMRHVAEFLDPLEVQSWSCCSKATRDACTMKIKLDSIFSYFRILKKYADAVHEAQYDWNVVMNLMLESLKVLRSVYGPYEVHPLHAAVVGELTFIVLARTRRARDDHVTLEIVWNGSDPSDCFVMGDHGDYFMIHDEEDEEGTKNLRDFVTKNADKFPAGPARVLAKEGRMPFVNMFSHEEEEHSEQIGLWFPNEAKKNDNDEIPVQVFCLNYQELPNPDDDETDFVEWYQQLGSSDQGYQSGADWKSIGQAFCQYNRSTWNDWTQLLRAGWLKAHQIAPFDATDHGKMLWDSVIESVGPELNKTTCGNEHESEIVEVLDFHLFDDEGDTWDDEEEKEEKARDIKYFAKNFLRQNHGLAKASDYQ